MRARCYTTLLSLGLPLSFATGQAPAAHARSCDGSRIGEAPPHQPSLERTLLPLAAPSDGKARVEGFIWCGHRWAVRPLQPTGRATLSDGIPDARGDGASMTGNGLSLHARTGIEGVIGPLAFRLAPELTIEENEGFETFPGIDPERSPLASPFYAGRLSADLPSRFGLGPRTTAHLGESGIWWRRPGLQMSVESGIPRWGPQGGEGLVIGGSAPGVPRAEVAVHAPLRGQMVIVRGFTGVLTESPFFDAVRANDWRPLTGVRVEWVAKETRLRLGAARTVIDGRRERSLLAASTLAVRRAPTDSLIDMTSLDGEWIDREGGSWGWVELARQVPITRAEDLLRQPTEGLALRFGGSQRIAGDRAEGWYVSAEFVRLDQPRQRADRPEQDLYTSPTVAQGWTQRGQPLGSGLGPGGQRQLLGLDHRGVRFRLGGFIERTRWNDGMLYRQFLTGSLRHDVAVLGGVHLSRADDPDALTIRAAVGRRFNYLFQNDEFNPGYRTADLPLLLFSILFTP